MRALPAHVLLEAYSVLTRMPAGLAVPAQTAAEVLARRFSGAPLQLDAQARRTLLATLAEVGVFGGAAYDGLIALEAHAHRQTLLTLDRRAQSAYGKLGVDFRAF